MGNERVRPDMVVGAPMRNPRWSKNVANDVPYINPEAFARLGEVPGVTYLDQLSDLSFGQLVETLPPAPDAAALRRHYEVVAGAKRR